MLQAADGCDRVPWQEHVHKNLAKVAANAQGGATGFALPAASTTMPLQPSSSANLIRQSSSDDKALSSAAQMMGKLQSIRNIIATSSSAEPAPASCADEPGQALRKSVTSLSASATSLSASAAPSSGAAAEAQEGAEESASASEATDVRSSHSVLSLQERLAKLRA